MNNTLVKISDINTLLKELGNGYIKIIIGFDKHNQYIKKNNVSGIKGIYLHSTGPLTVMYDEVNRMMDVKVLDIRQQLVNIGGEVVIEDVIYNKGVLIVFNRGIKHKEIKLYSKILPFSKYSSRCNMDNSYMDYYLVFEYCK